MASSHLDGTSLLAAINGSTSRNYVVVELDKDRAVVTSKCTPVAETALECHAVAALTQPSARLSVAPWHVLCTAVTYCGVAPSGTSTYTWASRQ